MVAITLRAVISTCVDRKFGDNWSRHADIGHTCKHSTYVFATQQSRSSHRLSYTQMSSVAEPSIGFLIGSLEVEGQLEGRKEKER